MDNFEIQLNMIESYWRSGMRRLLFLCSSCIYPKYADQPIREEALLTSSFQPTNEWYPIAKIAGLKLCDALRRQHSFDAISLMPTNLYGPGDNHHPTHGHVMGASIRHFYKAAKQPHKSAGISVSCWGTGKPLREFLHVDDLHETCVRALEQWDLAASTAPECQRGALTWLIMGTGMDRTIRELVKRVAAATGYRGTITWDMSKSDGTQKKQLDVSRLAAVGWRARIPLAECLNFSVTAFREQLSNRLLCL